VGASTTAAEAAQAAQETRAHNRAPSAAAAGDHGSTHATPVVLPLLPVSSSALEGDDEVAAVPSQASWGSALSSPVQAGHVSGRHRATLQVSSWPTCQVTMGSMGCRLQWNST
jgi:hypothetical protein